MASGEIGVFIRANVGGKQSRKQRVFCQQCAVNPRTVQVWGAARAWRRGRTELHGDGRVSSFNTDENRDDLANINILKCYLLDKRNFRAIAMGAGSLDCLAICTGISTRKHHHRILKIPTHSVIYGSKLLME